MSSRASIDSRHKKILRTRVKVWAKYLLKAEEAFTVNRAEQLIHKAIENKMSVVTTLKMYGDGLKIGDQGMLAALHAEFVSYSSIAGFISLRDAPTTLALCNKESGSTNCVTVLQFKDMDAMEIVCNLIDQQRGILTKGSLSRSEVAPNPAAPPPPTKAAAPAPSPVVVATAQPPAPVSVVVVVKEEKPQPQRQPSPQPEPEPEPPAPAVAEVEHVTVIVTETNGNTNGGEYQNWQQFTNQITQPPETEVIAAVVHAPMSSKSAAAAAVEDDDDNFRTSIVFGESAHVEDSTLERQKRMEALLERRGNGHAKASKSTDYIDAVILNYDDIDNDGTHAVFDSPDGPPIQLNESTENLRRRPHELFVTPNSTPSPVSRQSSSRLVVTSFSSGRSGSPTEGRVYLRAGSAANSGEPTYRTSAVIYRDAPLPDSPTAERPRVTYVTSQRSSNASGPSPAQQQQPVQIVRLVPVSSARRRVVQPQQQYFTIQAVGAKDNGVHLSAQ